MRNDLYLTFDTETANTLLDPFVYDIGGVVHDIEGNVIETFSFVVCDIFFGMIDVMQSAYYAKKIPAYIDDIRNGNRKLVLFEYMKKYFRKIYYKYNIKAIIAHNAGFDYRALQTTQRYLTCSKYRYFFPYGIEIWDTLKMARQVFGTDENYIAWCNKHDFVTNIGNPRMTAEVLYRYLINDENFIESHTGLEDALIEKEIFVHCMRINPDVEKKLFENKE